ncbi:MAG TPA: DUF4468 domain-containing protein [Prolixibacteraceae bacterium]|nr:DUF4468 domain-containing protein [Prolixibacteraceae bacterium]
MKGFFILSLLLLINLCVSAQISIAYSEVIQKDSVTKEDLYNRGLLWFAKSFKNPDEVIKYKDDKSCHILGKSEIDYAGIDPYYRGKISFEIELLFKDGRFKYEFKNFTHEGENINIGVITDEEEASFKAFGSSKAYRDREWLNIKRMIENEANKMKATLSKTIFQNAINNEDNW